MSLDFSEFKIRCFMCLPPKAVRDKTTISEKSAFRVILNVFLSLIYIRIEKVSDLIRIVKLQIKRDKTQEFKAIYEFGRKVVLSSPGCRSLQLCRDTTDDHIYFTISKWVNQEALNGYRSSQEFRSYWPKIKSLLSDKPEAYSLQDISHIDHMV